MRGEVLDAATAQPLASATVVLTPASPTAALPSRGRSPFVSAARSTTTDGDGRYRFTDIVPGQYRLHVQRLGYQAASLELALEGASESRVSVGLEVAPIRLAAMRVESTAVAPEVLDVRAAQPTEGDSSRVVAALARQREYLSADVREVTPGEVRAAVTLGEADLLRALGRLPGVRGAAALTVRGARWDLSRVYFDGVPLFAPYHMASALTGFPADAIGLATVLPGVRPASFGDGAASVIDLRSRGGSGEGRLNTRAELSLLTAALSLDQRRRDGRASWSLGARTGMPGLFDLDPDSRLRTPLGDLTFHHDFADLSGRADVALGARTRLEVSGLLMRDGDVLSPIYQSALHRASNGVARASFVTTLDRVSLRYTIAYAGWQHHGRPFPLPEEFSEFEWPDSLPQSRYELDSRVDRISLAGAVTGRGWRGGYEAARTSGGHEGFPFSSMYGPAEHVYSTSNASHWLVAGWGERRWHSSDRVELSAGLRLEGGTPILSTPALRLVPRIEGRYRLDSLTSLSAAIGRHWQYAQAVDRAGGGYPSGMGLLWHVAGSRTPATKVDIATLGVERWLAPGWLASGAAYARQMSGVLLLDPYADRDRRNNVVEPGRLTGGGADLGVRKLTGRLTGSAGYSLARETSRAFGLHHPSDLDVTHSADVTADWRFTQRLGIGAAFGFASGGTETPGVTHIGRDSVTGAWQFLPRYDLGPINSARRFASYALDVTFDWAFRIGAANGLAYVHFPNLISGSGELGNRHWRYVCTPPIADCPDPVVGIRRSFTLPNVGLRFRF